MATKESLHRLVDELPESLLEEAEQYLQALRDDPMLNTLLSAPWDDEPTTPEEDEGARLAREEIRRGEFLTSEQAKRELLG